MPQLTPVVRIASGSILLLSAVHILFWAFLAFSLKADLPSEFPYNYFFPILCIFSAAGIPGILVAAGLFKARNWARIAVLALGALVAFFCIFAVVGTLAVASGVLFGLGLGIEIPPATKTDLLRVTLIYFFILSIAIWWIALFSRQKVAAQFSPNATPTASAIPKKPVCPPPIALLAWLMIVSSALSAVSWPLILGRIPAMLFTHIFSQQTSVWIWIANILLFLVCGIGLLKLQRRSYTATIALHVFWLVSLLVTQLSPLYENYMRVCLKALEISENYPGLNLLRFPQWISALVSAIPTIILIAGLFYYRRGFLNAAAESSKH